MDEDCIVKNSIDYLNSHKKEFLNQYTENIVAMREKYAIFTAGMSGVGKTELAITLKEDMPNLFHIDTDTIRDFFEPIGYNGQNASLFQKASSRGFNELFSFALKKNFSLILDSNFANIQTGITNIQRLLKRDYHVLIIYMYDEPEKCFEYTVRREMVTHRKVPEEVFIKSNINSYKTVLHIKAYFKTKVALDFIDFRCSKTYEDIDIEDIKEKIGDSFDVK